MVDPNNPHKVVLHKPKVRPPVRSMRGDPGRLTNRGGDDFPALMAILCDVPTEGKSRETGKIKLWVADGRLTACVTYPAERCVTFLKISDIRDVLAEIEDHVANPELEWREDKFA